MTYASYRPNRPSPDELALEVKELLMALYAQVPTMSQSDKVEFVNSLARGGYFNGQDQNE